MCVYEQEWSGDDKCEVKCRGGGSARGRVWRGD